MRFSSTVSVLDWNLYQRISAIGLKKYWEVLAMPSVIVSLIDIVYVLSGTSHRCDLVRHGVTRNKWSWRDLLQTHGSGKHVYGAAHEVVYCSRSAFVYAVQ